MYKHIILAVSLSLVSTLSLARQTVQYEVTITNLTPGQTFTPQLVYSHHKKFQLFELGEPSSKSLEFLAEAGSTEQLTDDVANIATEVQTVAGLLGPGQSVSTIISGPRRGGYISLAAMLIPTNDSFIAVDSMALPHRKKGTVTVRLPAYDSGTEINDQSCQNMPGPRCPGGIGYSPESGEGFVHIGNGFHELGREDADGFEILQPQTYDWRNSVAEIAVRRIRH